MVRGTPLSRAISDTVCVFMRSAKSRRSVGNVAMMSAKSRAELRQLLVAARPRTALGVQFPLAYGFTNSVGPSSVMLIITLRELIRR